MQKLYNIPTNNQLYEISTTINEILKDTKKDNITISFELEKDQLRQLDEEYFFKNNPEVKQSDFVQGEMVIINIGDIKFNFINTDDSRKNS